MVTRTVSVILTAVISSTGYMIVSEPRHNNIPGWDMVENMRFKTKKEAEKYIKERFPYGYSAWVIAIPAER